MCEWLRREELGPEWKPSVAKFVIRAELDGRRMCIDVDPGFPTVWTREPYYSEIKAMARGVWHDEYHLAVYVGDDVTAVFPEEDLHVGKARLGDDLFAGYRWANDGSWRQPIAGLRRGDEVIREKSGQAYKGGRRV